MRRKFFVLFCIGLLFLSFCGCSRYVLEAELGSGKYAVCYRARRRNGKCVAIKVIKKTLDFINNENNVLNLVNEVLFLTKCRNCPFVVHFKKKIVIREIICLVMEYMKYGALTDWIEKIGRLDITVPEAIAKRALYDLMSACRFMELVPMIHMDIHSGNIMVSEDFHFKIGDFGLSERYYPEHPELASEIQSLPDHYPPEVLFQNEVYTPSSDSWSAGRAILAMILGVDFASSHISNALQVVTIDHPHLSDFAKIMKDFIVDPEPSNRLSAVELFALPYTCQYLDECNVAQLSPADLSWFQNVVAGLEKASNNPVLDLSDCKLTQDENDEFDETFRDTLVAFRKDLEGAKKTQ